MASVDLITVSHREPQEEEPVPLSVPFPPADPDKVQRVYSHHALSESEAAAMASMIEWFRPTWLGMAERANASIYVPAWDSCLPRSVIVMRPTAKNPEGRVLVKTTKAEGLLGTGTTKHVVSGYDYDTGGDVATASFAKPDEDEIANLRRFRNDPFFVHCIAVMKYPNKKGVEKTRIVLEQATGRDLLEAINSGTLTENQKILIFRYLAYEVAYLQGKGLLHRDLKAENVLLLQDGNGIFPIFGDLGSICEETDAQRKRVLKGTSWYISPELAKAQLEPDLRLRAQKIAEATTSKADDWSLGCILWQLSGQGDFPWQHDDEFLTFIDLARLKEDWSGLAPEKGTPLYYALKLLHPDPSKRMTAVELDIACNTRQVRWK